MVEPGYFERRIRSQSELRAKLPYAPLKACELLHYINNGNKKINLNNKSVIYYHIPFCTRTCNFCGYNRTIGDAEMIDKYFNILSDHVKQFAGYEGIKTQSVSAIFFGGGSPSCLDVKYLKKLLEVTFDNFNLEKNCEITVEFTVSDMNETKLKELLNAGVNRISIGVQSFQTKLRKNLGRLNDFEEIKKRINRAAAIGFENIYTDLIYGLPNQNRSDWEKDLLILEELPVAGCSIYPLINFPNSGMTLSGNQVEPDDEKEYEFYKLANSRLENKDIWTCYTPVQYGNINKGSSKYISLIAQDCNVLAFGASAAGKVSGYKYFNGNDILNFIGNSSTNFFEKSRVFKLHPAFEKYQQLLQLPLSLSVNKNTVESFDIEISEEINFLLDESMIQELKDNYCLTSKGRFWAGNISNYLIDTINKKTSLFK